jgi:hypothetical protein
MALFARMSVEAVANVKIASDDPSSGPGASVASRKPIARRLERERQ